MAHRPNALEQSLIDASGPADAAIEQPHGPLVDNALRQLGSHESPLVDNSFCPIHPLSLKSVTDTLAVRCARCVLRLRFRRPVYEMLDDELCNEVAWPIANMIFLIAAMLISTALTMHLTHEMNQGVAPHCVSYEYSQATVFRQGDNAVFAARSMDDIMEAVTDVGNDDDVRYKYLLVSLEDAKGRISQMSASYGTDNRNDELTWLTPSPWNTNTSHLDFPVRVRLFQENPVPMLPLIQDIVIVQLMNPLWLLCSCMSFWAWVHIPSMGPLGHLVQQIGALILVLSSARALVSPPPVHPPLTELELMYFEKCKGSSQGLDGIALNLVFQLVIGVFMMPAAWAVGMRFTLLTKISSAFNSIKVSQAADDHSGDTCSICLDSLGGNPSDPGSQDILWTLVCSHTFHKDCVKSWLVSKQSGGRHWYRQIDVATCPTCRATPFCDKQFRMEQSPLNRMMSPSSRDW